MLNSPYTPGAGHVPPVLAGRELLESQWTTMLSEVAGGGRKRARDTILRGPRGVGKTVLLSRFQEIADGQGYDTISLQAAAGGATLVDGIVARAQTRVQQDRPAWKRAATALNRLGNVNVTVLGTGGGVSLNPVVSPMTPPIDAGTLADTLATLADEIRIETPGGGLLITLDEMQVSRPTDLALIAAALQRLNVEHPDAPVTFAASALPTIDQVLDDAGVTHPDRLFTTKPVPVELGRADARYAIIEPARQLGVTWSEPGVSDLLDATHRYPAHLQLFADETWSLASGPTEITRDDAQRGIESAEALVQERTLDPRWAQATDREAEFLAALAVSVVASPADADHATATQIAAALERAPKEWSQVRSDLIREGDIYSPGRGRLAFTVPAYSTYILENYEPRRLEARLRLAPLALLTERVSRAVGEGGA